MAYHKELFGCMERLPRRCTRTLEADDLAIGKECLACDVAFVEGDRVDFIVAGPGSNELEQVSVGKTVYRAICFAAHAACMFGS